MEGTEVTSSVAFNQCDNMIDLHADDVESDEEPPELTDSESNDSDVSDYALERKDSVGHDSVTSSTTDDPTAAIDRVTVDFQQSLEQGSKACISQYYQTAMGHYRTALTLLTKHPDLQYERPQLAILLYALGVSEFNSGSVKSVQEGMTHFQWIINDHQEIFHVVAYYGLSCAYCRQNRYSDAVQPVEDGLVLIDRGLIPTDCYWPGTETVIHDLSSAQTLKDRFEDLQILCRTPPLPDAVCRYEACDGHFKRQIYLSDIDFKGFVCVHCQEKCVVEYHRDCWSRQKSSVLDVRLDKDVLNTSCLTPDCAGRICRLRFYGPDGGILKELPTETQEQETKAKRPKQKAAKAQQTAAPKSNVKKEKNMKEKVRATEAGNQSSSSVDDQGKSSVDASRNEKSKDGSVSSGPASDSSTAQNPVPLLPTDGGNFVALQKKSLDEEFSDPHHETKQKKARAKRERQRMQVYTGEFFKDPSPDFEPAPDDNYCGFGMRVTLEETIGFGKPVNVPAIHSTHNDYWDIPPVNTYNPPSLSSVVGDMSNSSQKRSTPSMKPVASPVSVQSATVNTVSARNADVTSSLYALFAKLLKDHGPMDPNDSVIERELQLCSTEAQVVICEAGGICKFLRQSLQFAVVDGYVCLVSDAGKARQLARSRRQVLLQSQQPPAKLNPPPSALASAAASAALPNNASSTPAVMKTYHSAAGMDLPLSSRVVGGPPQESVSELSYIPAFLSQPSATHGMLQPNFSSAAVIQTAVHGANNNDNIGIRQINGGNSYDSWKTVSNVAKSSSGLRNSNISTSGDIGKLDDFLEPFMTENSTNVDKLVPNKATVSDAGTKEEQLKRQAYNKQCNNTPGTSGSDSLDESSLCSSSSSVSEEPEMIVVAQTQSDASRVSNAHAMSSLDTFDTEVAETCGLQLDSLVTLSVNAPEFIPLTYAVNQSSVGKSSPKLRTSSQASSDSRPSSTVAVMTSKRVQTDDSWTSELQQLKDLHTLETDELRQQLSDSSAQLQQLEQAYDREKLQLASSWKAEKLGLEAELEKLRNELTFTNSNLERAYQMVVSAEGNLHHSEQLLNEEREKSKALKVERDKLEQLVMVMKASRAEASFPPPQMMMGYRLPQSFPGQMYMMPPPAAHDSNMASMSNRLPQPANANVSVAQAGVAAAKVSLATSVETAAAVAQSSMLPGSVAPAGQIVGASKSKQGLEKILDTLGKMFPDVRRTELSRYVQEVRMSRGNSLSGLTVHEIVSQVKNVIVRNQLVQQQQHGQASRGVAAARSVAGSVVSSGSASIFGDELFEEEENPCTVCLGELETGSTSKLDCGHIYHTECIRKWFREQSTCPTCRNYALLHDEFPTLHSASHAYR